MIGGRFGVSRNCLIPETNRLMNSDHWQKNLQENVCLQVYDCFPQLVWVQQDNDSKYSSKSTSEKLMKRYGMIRFKCAGKSDLNYLGITLKGHSVTKYILPKKPKMTQEAVRGRALLLFHRLFGLGSFSDF